MRRYVLVDTGLRKKQNWDKGQKKSVYNSIDLIEIRTREKKKRYVCLYERESSSDISFLVCKNNIELIQQ